MIIDTHSHLNFKAFDSDRDKVIKRAQKELVLCIDVGTKYETSKHAVDLAEKYKGIYAAIGMHPIYAGADLIKIKTVPDEGDFLIKEQIFDIEKYKKLALSSQKVVAIGEIGLDYYYKPKTKARLEQFKKKQKQIFIEQLKLAKELNLPVIVHCRMAHQDLIGVLKSQIQNSRLCGAIHCFTGSWEDAQKYLELGFYLGFNGIIYKLDLENVIKNCPLDKILLETDCPYLTPSAEGNKRNEPVFIKYVAETIAKIKVMSYERVSETTTQNARRLFKI